MGQSVVLIAHCQTFLYRVAPGSVDLQDVPLQHQKSPIFVQVHCLPLFLPFTVTHDFAPSVAQVLLHKSLDAFCWKSCFWPMR